MAQRPVRAAATWRWRESNPRPIRFPPPPTVSKISPRLVSILGLYLTSVLIWGSTWLAITFQFGAVPPAVSVVYRFALAGLILLTWARTKGLRLRFSLGEHLWMALQGFLLFGINYLCLPRRDRDYLGARGGGLLAPGHSEHRRGPALLRHPPETIHHARRRTGDRRSRAGVPAGNRPRHRQGEQIGRASCRERV